jgi:hypothetical protein
MRGSKAVLAIGLTASFFVASAPGVARAGDGFGAGLFGGLVAGTILGAAATSGPRYYAPAPVYVEPGPVYMGPSCYWTRGAPAWDDFRGMWVRPRVRVCD